MKILFNQLAKITALSVLCVFWLSIDSVQAQALPAPVFRPVYAPAVVGNTYTFGPMSVNSANAPSFTFGPAANGSVYGSANNALGLGGGRVANVVVKSPVTKAQIAKTVASAVGAGAIRFGPTVGGVVGALIAGKELYDLLNDEGYKVRGYLDGEAYVLKDKSGPGFECEMIYVHVPHGGQGCTTAAACSASGGTYYPGGQYAESCTRPGANLGLNFTIKPAPKPDPEFAPITIPELEREIANSPKLQNYPRLSDAIRESLERGGDPIDLPSPTSIVGPSSVPGPGPTTQTNPDGSTTTSTPTTNIGYGPNTVTVTDKTVVTGTDASGNPTGTTTTEKPAESPDIETCGLPGKAACKIDETGTPEAVQENKYQSKVDDLKTTVDTNRGVISGTSDKPFFEGWSVFFDAPAFVPCVPVPLPQFKGASMGSIDACPVVDGMRTVMGYIWAIGGLFMCLGMVRKVV